MIKVNITFICHQFNRTKDCTMINGVDENKYHTSINFQHGKHNQAKRSNVSMDIGSIKIGFISNAEKYTCKICACEQYSPTEEQYRRY